ncbi:hypothetical protein [Microbacterium sp. SS28]|uniref:hypothetical protein n=1 Tax=Microbacterium sp. SS28 TaxID=2919948 RepID=UPI001FA96FBA|nr:hypothetical protein [Microbacterium sp. SS28]
MEWTADVAFGEWIRARVDDPWRATMHDVVPRGFEAYARIFHAADRDRPVGRAWPPLPYGAHQDEWDAFQAAAPDIESERISWAESATAFGTTMHALAQWDHLVERFREVEGEDGPRDAAGWRYGRPMWGQLAPDALAIVAGILAEHTTAPDDAYAAVWEGWGGLVGGMGHGPSRVLFTLSSGDTPAGDAPQHEDFLARSAQDQLNNAFRKPTWQPGILSDDISRGPRLELPGRAHVVFRGSVREFADPEWEHRMPWADHAGEEFERAATAESPSLLWPADHAWVLVSEVDYDSTIVGGSPAAIRALCADPRLEALPIPAGAYLTWDADEVNR